MKRPSGRFEGVKGRSSTGESRSVRRCYGWLEVSYERDLAPCASAPLFYFPATWSPNDDGRRAHAGEKAMPLNDRSRTTPIGAPVGERVIRKGLQPEITPCLVKVPALWKTSRVRVTLLVHPPSSALFYSSGMRRYVGATLSRHERHFHEARSFVEGQRRMSEKAALAKDRGSAFLKGGDR